jgi:hypothetical protein
MKGGWRKLHNEELHNLYSSPSIIRMIKSRRIRRVGYVARTGENTRRKETTRKTKTWVDNIKIDLKRDRIGWHGLD